PVLESVGEPGRGVDVDGGRVDTGDEGVGRRRVRGDDRLRVTGPVRVDVVDRVLDRVDDGDRHLQRQVLGVPVLLGGGADLDLTGKCPRPLVTYQLDPFGGQRREDLGTDARGDRRVEQQLLGRVADAGALHLGADDDR